MKIFVKPLVLIGMMGSGKSHVGKLLSQKYHVPLYDIDALIEERQKKKIAEIFEKFGEAYFRELEFVEIERVLSAGNEPCVLSLGGGAVTTPKVLDLVKNKAVSVWLDVDIDVLFERTQRNKDRPLLLCENPKERLENLLRNRIHLYSQADIRADSSESDPHVVLDAIEKALYERGFMA